MTDIPEELVERASIAFAEQFWGPQESHWDIFAEIMKDEVRSALLPAIRAVLDWQAKEWVEIPRLDRP